MRHFMKTEWEKNIETEKTALEDWKIVESEEEAAKQECKQILQVHVITNVCIP